MSERKPQWTNGQPRINLHLSSLATGHPRVKTSDTIAQLSGFLLKKSENKFDIYLKIWYNIYKKKARVHR